MWREYSHEAALRILVSDRATARAQLEHLLEQAASVHISIRVIPFEREGFAGAASAMTYADGPVQKLDTVVRDGPHGASFIDAEAQLGSYREPFRRVKATSLDPQRSRDFIHRLTKEL
ncbi:hypothetical protein GCM10009601_00520 [Streptomyces thermospinosisporus]|uniref:DUF5753 domain-containing protein n=1 Tax=Streptomyces thermospinosisporus TaxID=161482 RepID=A0ABN1YHH9_9ACTN